MDDKNSSTSGATEATAPSARAHHAGDGGGGAPLPAALQPGLQSHRMAFSKLKALLRKTAERTVDGLWDAIGRVVDLITPDESAIFVTAAGYEP